MANAVVAALKSQRGNKMGLRIKGVIGWDVVGTSFADMMSRLSGDVDIEIDSPGGYVTDGLSIFNAIKSYKKGKVNIKVVGQASSMAAYIMLAGDTLTFMPNAIVVLHNPWNCACGDYRAMAKMANLLEKLAALYAEQFVEKGIFTEKEIRSIMDEETWFVGKKDLAKLGQVETSEDESGADDLSPDRDIVIQAAMEKITQCKAKMSETQFDLQSLDRIAALLPATTPAAAASVQPAQAPPKSAYNMPETQTGKIVSTINQGDETMENAKELQAKYPQIYAEVFEAGRAAGQSKEKERVTALIGFLDDSKDTIVAAIKDGGDITNPQIQADLLQARMKAQTLAGMQAANPKAVDPQEPEHGAENEQAAEQAAADQAAADEQARVDKIAALMGI